MILRTILSVTFSAFSLSSCDDLLFKDVAVKDDDYFTKKIAVTKSPSGEKTFYFGEQGIEGKNLLTTQLYLEFSDGSGKEVFYCYGHTLNLGVAWKTDDTLLVQAPASLVFERKNEVVTSFEGKSKVIVVYN